jgi:hypothetical protein
MDLSGGDTGARLPRANPVRNKAAADQQVRGLN